MRNYLLKNAPDEEKSLGVGVSGLVEKGTLLSSVKLPGLKSQRTLQVI